MKHKSKQDKRFQYVSLYRSNDSIALQRCVNFTSPFLIAWYYIYAKSLHLNYEQGSVLITVPDNSDVNTSDSQINLPLNKINGKNKRPRYHSMYHLNGRILRTKIQLFFSFRALTSMGRDNRRINFLLLKLFSTKKKANICKQIFYEVFV